MRPSSDRTLYVAVFCRENPPRCDLCVSADCTHECHEPTGK